MSSSDRRRRGAAAAVALLAVLCGLLLVRPSAGEADAHFGPAPRAAAGPSAAADGDAGRPAVTGDRGEGTGSPECRKSPDGDGSLPVARGAAQQHPSLLPDGRSMRAAGQEALSRAHTTPTVPGPSPVRAPGPVDLSVLRV